MKLQHHVHNGLLRLASGFSLQPSDVAGKILPASDTVKVSFQQFPKNMDVKHIRPSLSDRIDLALLEFPGRTALLFAALAALVVIVASVVT
jgi:hypothetical protein